LTLIDDTLDFAKIEAGKLRVQIGDVPLAGLVDVLREIIGVKAEQKGLDFICEIAGDAPAGVRADGQRLRQVLLNLLANAVKFTDHGSVSLHIMRAEPGAVRFEVRDTGVGMLAEQLETIFEPFEQVGRPERRVGGTGLGLAISRQFVRAMGGEIHVESRVGEGSLFWFELGAALALPDAPVTAPPARDVTGYDGPRRKVLVIDDVPVNRAVVITLLERLGFDTVEAATGREGLEQAQHERPSLVVTDIVMPDMDGLEVTQRLRQSPGIADVPIIAVSASPSGTDEKRSLDAGVNAFLPKPVDFDRLLEKIAALLGLEWTYATAPATAPATAQQGVSLSEASLAVPSQEMNELHRLARHGDMREISLWSERVAALDARYVPFAEQVRLLAKGYQSKAILELVEQNLVQRPAP
jgi:CheY-like chemotaxis protein/anti-sigma regulatory factor (Ser/Thr protein kinase)